MLRTILIFGTIGGLIAGGFTAIIPIYHDIIPTSWAMTLGYTTMLIALTTVFVGIKRQRDTAGGGVIRFWPALGMGLAISLIAGIFYALGWEIALMTMGGPDGFIDGYIAGLRAGRGHEAEIAQMEAMKISYRNPLFRLPMSFSEIAPVGVLVSVVSAALLRNSRFLPAR